MSFLAIISVTEAQVADFAPLEVGNTWIYQGSHSSLVAGRHAWSSVQRTLQVLGRTGSGGSATYEVSVRDSLYARKDSSTFGEARNLPDTVSFRIDTLVESGDTLSSDLQAFFHRHSVPDSHKNRVVETQVSGSATLTEKLAGPFPIEGAERWVFQLKTRKLLGMGAAATDSSIFVQNLGAVLVEGSGGRAGTTFSSSQYRLTAFNGNPVEYRHMPGTSTRPETRNLARPAAKGFRSVPLFQGNRDGLGRRRPRG